jgi:hypothetical protein
MDENRIIVTIVGRGLTYNGKESEVWDKVTTALKITKIEPRKFTGVPSGMKMYTLTYESGETGLAMVTTA